jgi:hypothetical protein
VAATDPIRLLFAFAVFGVGAAGLQRRHSVRRAIERIAATVFGCLVVFLALLGLPFALVIASLFRRRFLSSPRPGILGLEDVLRGMFALSSLCGTAMILLIGLGLVIGRYRV